MFEIGATIRLRREALGMSQEELARLAGLDQPYISKLERGLFPNVELNTLERIAAVLRLEFRLTPIDDPSTEE